MDTPRAARSCAAACTAAGLSTLVHTPSPMGFLRELLGRPRFTPEAHERTSVPGVAQRSARALESHECRHEHQQRPCELQHMTAAPEHELVIRLGIERGRHRNQ